MSYEIFKHRDHTNNYYESWIYSLVGKGEHEGTIFSIPQDVLFRYKFENDKAMAAFLDDKFLIAHGERMAREVRSNVEED